MKTNTNYLHLNRRGCMFYGEDKNKSDVGNYRVFVRFIDKAGTEVCGDLSKGNVYDYSFKTPRLVNDVAMNTDLQWEDFRGCWQYRAAVDPRGYSYTISGILAFINAIAADHYDDIKWVQEIETVIDKGANFTPASLIKDWANKNCVKFENSRYGETVVKLYTGDYKYMSYRIEQLKHDHTKEKVIITLEEA
jgi:hypothetical protein